MEENIPRAREDYRTGSSMRCGLVVCTAMVAYSVPDFGKFLSLVGSSICTILGFILPTYFHVATMKSELAFWQICLDAILLVGGVSFGILGTIQSIQKLANGEAGE